MKPATLIKLAIKLKIIPVKEDKDGGYSLSLLNIRYIGWNVLFLVFFSVYTYNRFTTMEVDLIQFVYLASGTSVVSLVPAIQLMIGIMMDRAEGAMTYCPETSPLITIIILLNAMIYSVVLMAQDFMLIGVIKSQDYLAGAAITVSCFFCFIMLTTQFTTVYTLCISLTNKLEQLMEKKDITLPDLESTLELYTNVQSALEHSGLMIFSTIQLSLIGTIYLFISGAQIWAGSICTASAILVVTGFVLKVEDIYSKVVQASAKGRECANRQSSVRELYRMKDKAGIHILRSKREEYYRKEKIVK